MSELTKCHKCGRERGDGGWLTCCRSFWRLKEFYALSMHAWLGRVWRKLTESELEICQQFLYVNGNLSKGDFEHKVNRMFLDSANRPKHHTMIMELLVCANSNLKE